MAKRNTNGLIPLVLGLLLLLVVFNNTVAREAPVFDENADQDFRLELTSFDSTPDAGTDTDIEVTVLNRGENGSMFVQCSILNYLEEGSFLVNRAASVELLDDVNPNCVNPEPFTQTADVFLEADNQTIVVFTVVTPSDEDGDYTIYCEAFEQCWSESTPDTYTSDTLTRDVTVVFDSPEAINATSGVESGSSIIDLDNDGIRDFMRDNSFIVVLIAIGLMIIGGIMIYGFDKK